MADSSDDLAAVLRRELMGAFGPRLNGAVADDFAARLAEVVREHMPGPSLANAEAVMDAIDSVARERDAAHRELAEAAGLLRELVECPQPSSDYANAFKEARAYLARQGEGSHD